MVNMVKTYENKLKIQSAIEQYTSVANENLSVKFYYLSVKFYYIREWYTNIPRITLCTVRDKTTHNLRSLGVAVCSIKDMPNKKIGKQIAMGRAFKNLQNGEVFTQQNLKKVKIVQELLNESYSDAIFIPPHVNMFMELIEFKLNGYNCNGNLQEQNCNQEL